MDSAHNDFSDMRPTEELIQHFDATMFPEKHWVKEKKEAVESQCFQELQRLQILLKNESFIISLLMGEKSRAIRRFCEARRKESLTNIDEETKKLLRSQCVKVLQEVRMELQYQR
eukprot:EG_transcript_52276